jgi:hypothetical protein
MKWDPQLTAMDVLTFLVPAESFLQIALVGKLVVSELLALLLLPWLFRARERVRAPSWIFLLWAAWLASQVITDLVVHSTFADWARGWAGIVFTLVNLLAVLALASTPRRARIFASGIATGGILGFFFAPYIYAATDPWKWAFALPVGYLIAVIASNARVGSRPWLPVLLFALFGLVNALLVFRSLSGVALVTAGYLLAAWIVRDRLPRTLGRAKRVGLAVAIYGTTGVTVFVGLNAAAAAGVFGAVAQQKFDDQTGVPPASTAPTASIGPEGAATAGSSAAPAGSAATSAPTPTPANPMAIIAGGRAEILSSTRAILDSPILGHGSWAKDPKYVELQKQGLQDLNIPRGNAPTDPSLIPTHSYLLGSWVWAGFAGGLFWAAIAALALWVLANLFGSTSPFVPLIVFVTTLLLWNIAFSPYIANRRSVLLYGVVVCLLGLRTIRREPEPA